MKLLYESLKNNTTLNELILSVNNLKDEGMVFISDLMKSKNSQIFSLYLKDNKITSKGFKFLVENGLINNKSLRIFGFGHNLIDSEGAKSLINHFSKNKNICVIFISNNPFVFDDFLVFELIKSNNFAYVECATLDFEKPIYQDEKILSDIDNMYKGKNNLFEFFSKFNYSISKGNELYLPPHKWNEIFPFIIYTFFRGNISFFEFLIESSLLKSFENSINMPFFEFFFYNKKFFDIKQFKTTFPDIFNAIDKKLKWKNSFFLKSFFEILKNNKNFDVKLKFVF